MNLMNNSPYDFIMSIDENDIDWMMDFNHFAHRTFNGLDAIHFINVLRLHYWFNKEESLETAFTKWMQPNDSNVENALNGFYHFCFDKKSFADMDNRHKKHIAAPFKKSACKRLNMFLRWMVRNDKQGVDFGLWKNIQPLQLVIPMMCMLPT